MARRPNHVRDQKIAGFVKDFLHTHGFAPTHRHIQKALKIDHLISVQRSLARLKSMEEESEGTHLPLVGRVAAGSPIEAIENVDKIEVPSWMLKKNKKYFVLKVKGNSMIEDGIFDEDYVLIRKEE